MQQHPYRRPMHVELKPENSSAHETEKRVGEKKKTPRRRLGFFKAYLIVCGIAVNLYGLIWLLIQLFTRLGSVLPKP